MTIKAPVSLRERAAHRLYQAGIAQPNVTGRPVVFDYSFWSPTTAQLVAMKAAGVVGVSRYFAPSSSSKTTDKREFEQILAVGLSFVGNWEDNADNWRGGARQGAIDGAEARRQARAIGYPDACTIVQSIDTDIFAHQYEVAAAYQRAFNDAGGCGPQRVYGTCGLMTDLEQRGLVKPGNWQCMSRGFVANGFDCPRAAMIQRTSHSFPQFPPSGYDENTVMMADWGQFPRPGEAPLTQAEIDQAALRIAERWWT